MFKIGLALVALLGLAGVYVYGLATATPVQLALKTHQLANCERDLKLRDGREASFRRMIDRRDRAIAQTQCAKQIQHWVRNPDQIPKKFDPFNDSPLAPPR